jgi:hypothetical protein
MEMSSLRTMLPSISMESRYGTTLRYVTYMKVEEYHKLQAKEADSKVPI